MCMEIAAHLSLAVANVAVIGAFIQGIRRDNRNRNRLPTTFSK